MEQQIRGRTRPECGNGDYDFRSGKKVAEAGKGEAMETKYRRKACGNDWKARVQK